MSIKKQNSIKKLQKKVKFKLSADLVDVESQKQSTEGIQSPQKATVDSGTENHFLILDEFGTDHDFPSDWDEVLKPQICVTKEVPDKKIDDDLYSQTNSVRRLTESNLKISSQTNLLGDSNQMLSVR